jgi:hypothetical protein
LFAAGSAAEVPALQQDLQVGAGLAMLFCWLFAAAAGALQLPEWTWQQHLLAG